MAPPSYSKMIFDLNPSAYHWSLIPDQERGIHVSGERWSVLVLLVSSIGGIMKPRQPSLPRSGSLEQGRTRELTPDCADSRNTTPAGNPERLSLDLP